jgi:hypothetical protein
MMVVGNNVNGAYSEGDMIRERAADNLGMATDSQLMQLNSGTHVSISVPATPRSTLCGRSTRKDQTPAPRQKRTQHRRSTQEHTSSPAGTGRVSFAIEHHDTFRLLGVSPGGKELSGSRGLVGQKGLSGRHSPIGPKGLSSSQSPFGPKGPRVCS